jgi:hypothetical protein
MPPKRPIVRFSVTLKRVFSMLYYDPCKGPLHLGLFFKLPKFHTPNAKAMVKYKKSQYRSYLVKAVSTF